MDIVLRGKQASKQTEHNNLIADCCHSAFPKILDYWTAKHSLKAGPQRAFSRPTRTPSHTRNVTGSYNSLTIWILS